MPFLPAGTQEGQEEWKHLALVLRIKYTLHAEKYTQPSPSPPSQQGAGEPLVAHRYPKSSKIRRVGLELSCHHDKAKVEWRGSLGPPVWSTKDCKHDPGEAGMSQLPGNHPD